jgi:hypothetical protein
MTTLPALSTPCTWNTFLARSTPMVLTCMWTTPSSDSLFNDHPFGTFDAGSGRRPLHHSRPRYPSVTLKQRGARAIELLPLIGPLVAQHFLDEGEWPLPDG